MVKKLVLLAVVLSICAGCQNQKNTVAESEESAMALAEAEKDEAVSAESESDVSESVKVLSSYNKVNDANPSFDSKVPFSYAGDDKILKTVTEAMLIDADEKFATEGIVEIPTPYIVKIDDSDKNDIKVFGDFQVYGYALRGTIFYMENYGSMPGCYHLKEDESGVVSFASKEIAEDGSGFEPSLKKICGNDQKLYDDILKRDSNDSALRFEYIDMYAKANGLRILGIKDYGWPIILANGISDAEFLYNFYLSYFGELLDDNLLNDKEKRLENLDAKYMDKALIDKIKSKNEELGIDFVVGASDITSEALNTLQVDDYGDGKLKVRFVSNKSNVSELDVTIENRDETKIIADINIVEN